MLYAYNIEAMELVCAEIQETFQVGRYFYAYKSTRKAAAEESSYLARREKQKDFQLDTYE